MTKKAFSLLLVLALLLNGFPQSARAEHTKITIPVLYDSEAGTEYIAVIEQGDELYMPAETLAKITGYNLTESTNSLKLTRGMKNITVNIQTGELRFLGKVVPLGTPLQEEGQHFLPLSELLPWLNTNCSVEDGILNIATDPLSYWEVIDGFNTTDYLFMFEDELGGKKTAMSIMLPMLLFDSILKVRIGRAISFKGGSLREYNVYMETFREFASDELIVCEYAEKVVKTVNRIVDLQKFHELMQDLERRAASETTSAITGQQHISANIRESVAGIGSHLKDFKKEADRVKLKEFFSALSLVETTVKSHQDYYKSFIHIYGADSKKPKTIAEHAAHQAYYEFKSAEGAIAGALLDYAVNCVKDVIKEKAENMVSKTMQHTKTLLKGIDALLTFLWPVNVAAEEISNLPVYVNIHQDALDSYAEYFLSSDMSAERIEAARLSALMYLQAGRKALRAKQKMMDRFGGKGLLDLDLEQYDEKIAQFALSAPATENDSTDDKSSRVAELKKLFRKVQRTSSVDIFDSLNNQEKRNLNIFLSNFSEAGLPYYNAYQKHTAANSLHLMGFILRHYCFNIHGPAEYINKRLHGKEYLGIPLTNMSDRLNRFFYGLNCTPEFIDAAFHTEENSESCGLFSDGKYLLKEPASGAQINSFSQVTSLAENKDGTLDVQIDIYTFERRANDGLLHGEVPNWVYDPSTTWSESNKNDALKIETATATLVRYEHRGKPSYQLVEYEVLTQTQKNQKD